MKRLAGSTLLIVAAAALGCGSDEKKPDPAPAAAKPAAPDPPPPEDDGGQIVIKGSKHADADTPREEPRRNQAKIDELTRQAAEGGATAKWIDFTSEDGRFTVALPQKPAETSQNTRGATGLFTLHVYKVSLVKPDERFYGVSWFELAAAGIKDPVAFLAATPRNIAASMKGRTVDEKSISLDGNPGRQARIEVVGKTTVIARLRIYVVGTRVYQLTAATPAGEADGRDVTKFLDSFKVTVPAAPDPK